jgi:hypothetical protein
VVALAGIYTSTLVIFVRLQNTDARTIHGALEDLPFIKFDGQGGKSLLIKSSTCSKTQSVSMWSECSLGCRNGLDLINEVILRLTIGVGVGEFELFILFFFCSLKRCSRLYILQKYGRQSSGSINHFFQTVSKRKEVRLNPWTNIANFMIFWMISEHCSW